MLIFEFLFLLIYLVAAFLGIILPLLLAVAFLTLAERKVLASMQRRTGPNVVGFLGLLQPLADGAKLILKETVIAKSGKSIYFFISSCIDFFLKFIKLDGYSI